MSALRRVCAGNFEIEKAYSLDEIKAAAAFDKAEELLLPVDSLFEEYPSLSFDENKEKRIRCGNSVKTAAEDGTYRVYSKSGEFLMLGKVEKGILSTVKSFFEVRT